MITQALTERDRINDQGTHCIVLVYSQETSLSGSGTIGSTCYIPIHKSADALQEKDHHR